MDDAAPAFLENSDLSGKQVYLFCSHGTGGLANSVEQIAEASPETVISDNIFDCYEEDASSSEDAIRSWASDLGYSRQKDQRNEYPGGLPDVRFPCSSEKIQQFIS